ncbi:MAG: hypothetical protein V4534_08020 [Myxococcota bacterium]
MFKNIFITSLLVSSFLSAQILKPAYIAERANLGDVLKRRVRQIFRGGLSDRPEWKPAQLLDSDGQATHLKTRLAKELAKEKEQLEATSKNFHLSAAEKSRHHWLERQLESITPEPEATASDKAEASRPVSLTNVPGIVEIPMGPANVRVGLATTAARNQGVVCSNFKNGNCTVMNCPYAHLSERAPIPRRVCTYYQNKVCLRPNCGFFHGSQEALTALQNSGARDYDPALGQLLGNPVTGERFHPQQPIPSFTTPNPPPIPDAYGNPVTIYRSTEGDFQGVVINDLVKVMRYFPAEGVWKSVIHEVAPNQFLIHVYHPELGWAKQHFVRRT